ncbi:MAG: dicarboxylate/amino acid:cation symporter [Parachlamydiales bacterium]|nr:dicarboxylate/amino acid:cation symporter [Parachlamydiales bacterium]
MEKGKLILDILLLAVGLLIGGFAGITSFAWVEMTSQAIADLFIHFLKLISLPLIFLSIISTLSGMSNLKEMNNLGKRVFGYTLLTTLLAATSALVLFQVIQPVASIPTTVIENSSKGYLSFFINIVPDNLVKAFLENNVIGVAFLAILMGCASLVLPQEQRVTINQFFKAIFALFLQMTKWVLRLMPIGIAAFTCLLVIDLKTNGAQAAGLSKYLLCVLAANIVQGFVILPLLLKLKKQSPLAVVKGMLPALILAFFSKSSNATLPVAMTCCEKNLNVSNKVTGFSLPLCTVINMNGCAAFILITVLFVATANGMTFTLMEGVTWIFLATLAAIGNAGVPMGCFFLTSAFLTGMHVPLAIMGLILPFYALIDMVETSLNVWSDGCVTVLVDKDLKKQESYENRCANI